VQKHIELQVQLAAGQEALDQDTCPDGGMQRHHQLLLRVGLHANQAAGHQQRPVCHSAVARDVPRVLHNVQPCMQQMNQYESNAEDHTMSTGCSTALAGTNSTPATSKLAAAAFFCVSRT
jgi:hypothetical protein